MRDVSPIYIHRNGISLGARALTGLTPLCSLPALARFGKKIRIAWVVLRAQLLIHSNILTKETDASTARSCYLYTADCMRVRVCEREFGAIR